MTIDFPPGLILIVAACVLPFLRGKANGALAVAATVATLAATVVGLVNGFGSQSLSFLPGLDLQVLQVNAPTKVFALIFSVMACVGTVFAVHAGRRWELSGALLYAGAAICATFAGDLLSLFIFWELMAIGSTLVVLCGGQSDSGPAGWRYAAVHFVGGALFLAGITAWMMTGGSLVIPTDPLNSDLVASFGRLDSAAAWLILAGILVNAGAPPFSAWLPDAYPEASPSGTVFLSAFTTKTAVFVLMMLFAGTAPLIWVGIAMAIYGLIYAIIENDARRILAYSIISQVGFMVCAIGIGTPLALAGATAHAFSHIIYKALLLMAAGSVLEVTGKRRCVDFGQLYRSMPITTSCAIIGALAMAAAPLTSGFTTKSLITSAVADLKDPSLGFFSNPSLAWFSIAMMAVGVAMYVAIKFPWILFFQEDSGERPPEPSWNMRLAMIVVALLCIAVGIYPQPLYGILPYAPTHLGADGQPHLYQAWTIGHVVGNGIMVLIAAAAFLVCLRYVKRAHAVHLDWDWLYRTLPVWVWITVLAPIMAQVQRGHTWLIGKVPAYIADYVQVWRYHRMIAKDVTLGHMTAQVHVDLKVDRGSQWAVGGVLVVITGILGLYLLLLLTGWG